MSTSTSGQTGRDKLAQLRAQEARQARQKKLLALVAALVALVIVGLAILWAVSRDKSDDASTDAGKNGAFVSKVTGVPTAAFDKAGADPQRLTPPNVLAGAPKLEKDGKPRFIFYGAEFCPYCAMERWAVVSALSRFGTWSGLEGEVSSEGKIPSMSFVDAKYTSKYVDFTGYELSDQEQKQLQKPTDADDKLFKTYDTPQYFPSMQQGGSIPFMVYGGTRATSGSTFNQADAMSNKTPEQIADKLHDAGDPVSKDILGAANLISAQLCQQTGGQPASTCNADGVKAAAKLLKK